MKKYFYLMMAIALILGWIFDPQGWAQTGKPYPSRQITYTICFSPDGQSDRAARMQQPFLEKFLKQEVVIKYTIGGGGAIGWGQLAKAKPDGYSIAGFNLPHIILQPLLGKVDYKTEQIVPVALFERTPLALAVHKSSPYKSYHDFIGAAHSD